MKPGSFQEIPSQPHPAESGTHTKAAAAAFSAGTTCILAGKTSISIDPVKLEADKLVDIALSMSMRPVPSHAFDTKVLPALEDRAASPTSSSTNTSSSSSSSSSEFECGEGQGPGLRNPDLGLQSDHGGR